MCTSQLVALVLMKSKVHEKLNILKIKREKQNRTFETKTNKFEKLNCSQKSKCQALLLVKNTVWFAVILLVYVVVEKWTSLTEPLDNIEGKTNKYFGFTNVFDCLLRFFLRCWSTKRVNYWATSCRSHSTSKRSSLQRMWRCSSMNTACCLRRSLQPVLTRMRRAR